MKYYVERKDNCVWLKGLSVERTLMKNPVNNNYKIKQRNDRLYIII